MELARAIPTMPASWRWRSREGALVAAAAAVFGGIIGAAPFLTAGVIIGLAVLAASIAWPLGMAGALLLIGPSDLSFLTGGEKALLEGAGGLDMNGIRLVMVVLGFGVVALARRETRAMLFGRYGVLYVAFLGFALARTALASPDALEGLRLFFKMCYPLLFMVIVAGLVRRREQLDRLGDLLLIGAALIVFVLNPIIFLEGGGYEQDMLAGVRAGGVGVHPAPFSLYLAMMIVFAFSRMIARRQMRYLVLIAGCGYWLLLTQTRTGIGALVLALVAMAVLAAVVQRSGKVLAIAGAAAALLAVVAVPVLLARTFPNGVPTIGELMALRYDPVRVTEYVTLSGRELFWPVVYQAFQEAPVVGQGLGTSTVVILNHFTAEQGGVVHNEYLRLLSDTGVVGLGLFAAALFAWLAGALIAAARRTPGADEWAFAAVGSLVIWGFGSIFDNGLDYYTQVGQFVGTMAGGALIVGRRVSAADDGAVDSMASPIPQPATLNRA